MRYAILGGINFCCGLLSFSANATPQTYQLEPTHVDVLFSINHLGFSSKHGLFRAVAGTLIYDADHPEASHVTITIKTDSVDTSFAARDTDLKSDKFFDAMKFPTMEFKSTNIIRTGGDSFRVVGDLTLHGVTKPITLEAKLNGAGKNPFDQKPTVGFSLSGTLKRSDFGISEYLPAIGDLVTLTADAEFNQAAQGTK